MANQSKKAASTQAHLPIIGIEDGVAIVQDGSYRAVLKVTSTNFLLKSDQEQQALIGSYQNFINSLNFPIQIVMQSRQLDLEPYLKKLEASIVEQRNELIRQQTTDYVAYVRELINVANIMDKQFFVVVPYTPLSTASKNLFAQMFSHKGPVHLSVDEIQFKAHTEELAQRAGIIVAGLGSLGLRAVQLDTDGLVRLFYNVYNYDIAMAERLEDPHALAGGIVSSEDNQQNSNQPESQESIPTAPIEPTPTTKSETPHPETGHEIPQNQAGQAVPTQAAVGEGETEINTQSTITNTQIPNS